MNGNQYLRLRHNWSWNLGGGVAVENVGEGKEKKGGTIGEGGGRGGTVRTCESVLCAGQWGWQGRRSQRKILPS